MADKKTNSNTVLWTDPYDPTIVSNRLSSSGYFEISGLPQYDDWSSGAEKESEQTFGFADLARGIMDSAVERKCSMSSSLEGLNIAVAEVSSTQR